MRGGFTNVRAGIAPFRKALAELRKQAIAATQRTAGQALEALFSRTPVWEGTTVRNYVVGIGGAGPGGEKPPIDNGPPGATSLMAMGSEPRRDPNEAAAWSEGVAAIRRLKKLQSIHITNNADIFDQVDAGAAPTTGEARNPGGVVLLATQLVRAQSGGLWS